MNHLHEPSPANRETDAEQGSRRLLKMTLRYFEREARARRITMPDAGARILAGVA